MNNADDPVYVLCTSKQLRAIAEHLEQRARQYRIRAEELDEFEAIKARSQAHLDALSALPDLVASYLARGYGLDAARVHVARDSGAPIETVVWYWRKWCRDQDKKATEQRHALVAKLAARGLTNHEIADRTGLHPGSVSRIITKTFRTPKREA